MRADMPDLPDYPSSPGRTASIINFFLGAWVLVSPFVLGFADNRNALWNNVIVGIAIMVIAGVRAWFRSNSVGLSWINFVLGIWLIVSAFIFGYQVDPLLIWNQVISGVAVAVVSAVAAMGRPYLEPPVVR